MPSPTEPAPPVEWRRDEFTVSTDPARLDPEAIQAFLAGTYWAEGVSRAKVARALAFSLCFGLYHAGRQIGLARVITDRATFGYLADVYVLEPYRGRGLSAWLVECLLAHPDVQSLRRINLVTRDAHGLYRRFGFTEVSHPGRCLELHRPERTR